MATDKKKKKKRVAILIVLLSLLLVGVAVLAVLLYLDYTKPRVVEGITLEAGSKLPVVEDFLLDKDEFGKIVSGIDENTSMNTVADYPVVVRVEGRDYQSVLHVVDTVEPVVEVEDASIFIGTEIDLESLVTSVIDETATTIDIVKEPDWTQAGEYEVEIVVTDEGNNQAVATTTLEIEADTVAPVIEGVQDITVAAGESVSYKRGVTVTDDHDEKPELEVDNSQVNLNKEGEYTVTYTAIDNSGNETTVEAKVTVTKPQAEQATEEYINQLADERLAKIITDDMTDKEKARAIFRWVHDNIAYSDGSPKDNWVQGAYYGLVKFSGDCYVYAMTSKVLLTRAGIKNMDIKKIPARTRHYWNLIDLGDGWYHFDATRRKDGTEFFYVSDEELMKYSKSHDNSHNYDPDEYPEIE